MVGQALREERGRPSELYCKSDAGGYVAFTHYPERRGKYPLKITVIDGLPVSGWVYNI